MKEQSLDFVRAKGRLTMQALMSSFNSSNLPVFCIVFFISWILIHRWAQRNRKGPKTWPLIGAAIEQFNNYDRMHDWIANYLSESKTITVPMPFTTYTYTADPANVEHILKNNFKNYPKGELYRSYMEVLLGDGIFNADGELWRKQRKTASFEFASKNLRELSTVVFREYALNLSTILCQASCRDHQGVDIQVILNSTRFGPGSIRHDPPTCRHLYFRSNKKRRAADQTGRNVVEGGIGCDWSRKEFRH